MKILCPHCGVKGSADDSYCDRKVKCPKCDTLFLVQAEMALDQDSSEQTIASVLDASVLESEPTEVSVSEVALVEESESEQVTDAESVEEVDWSGLSAELDQQLQDSESEERQSLEVSEETHGLLDDLQGIEDPEETGLVAGIAEAEVEDLQAEEIPENGISEEAETGGVVDDAEIEKEPYGLAREQCWQCGKEDSVGEPFIAKDGRLYCTDCLPDEFETEEDTTLYMSEEEPSMAGASVELDDESEMNQVNTPHYSFTITEAIKEAWDKTKGAKGSIWGASAIMYLVTLIMVAGGALLFPGSIDGMVVDLKTLALGMVQQLVTSIVSVLFTAGLLYMGIRKVVGDPISWRMIGKGFSSAGNLILATILQFVLITIGFCLLILPGIYLVVGYLMTLPLIVDKGMSPWQAMETSRKTIHKIWWKVFGLFIVMWLISMLSLIPLGIGLIWTWPMCIILVGVLYCYLFGTADPDE